MPKFTYKKRLGVRNIEKKPAARGVLEGQITEWWTKDGLPAIYPDQWEGSFANMEPLPDDITDVGYVGK